MNWKRAGYGWHLTVSGECNATITMFYDRAARRDSITALVTTPLFPRLEQSEFYTIASAKAWCEQWMSFATELLSLRHAVEELREHRQKDFDEILQLRDELHGYRYPKKEEII